MIQEPVSGLFFFGAMVWVVLCVIWLFALGKGLRPLWMHLLHMLLPLMAVGAYLVMPKASVQAGALWTWLAAGVSILAILTPVWLVTLWIKNSSVMDVLYSPAASVTALVLLMIDGSFSARQVVFMAIIAIWSGRLIRHAMRTNLGESGEQQPYVKWRAQYGGDWWWLSYFQVFALQGGLIWVWVLPIAAGMAVSGPVGALEVAGIGLWLVGFVFQAGADWQLKQFKADPVSKGKVLQAGLWSLCRHPNYFGEIVMWWAYFVFGLAHPLGCLAVFGPLYVTWFMAKGSAAPMLDRHMLKSKPDFADYMERVPGIIPFIRTPGDAKRLARHRARNG